MPDGIATMQASLAQALEDLHTRIAAAVLGLDADALDWQPGPAMPSLHELITHAAGEERRWIGEGIGNIPAAEEGRFAVLAAANSQTVDHALFELGSIGQASQMILASLAPADWAEARHVAGRATTVAGCLLNTVVELGRVLGHIESVAQLWNARVLG